MDSLLLSNFDKNLKTTKKRNRKKSNKKCDESINNQSLHKKSNYKLEKMSNLKTKGHIKKPRNKMENINDNDFTSFKRTGSNDILPKTKKIKKKNRNQSNKLSFSVTESSPAEIDETKQMNVPKKNKKKVEHDSETSDEDIEIRKELENLPVYKSIKKLLKNNPSLLEGFTEMEVISSESVEKHDADSDISDESSLEDDETSDIEKNSSVCSKKMKSSELSAISNNPNINQEENKFRKNNASSLEKNSSVFTKKNPKVSKSTTEVTISGPSRINQEENMFCRSQIKSAKQGAFKNKAKEKLQAAKFRYLNEKLYTESGKESFDYFQKNKEEFLDYHTGYRQQISKWPINPVDKIINSLQNMKKNTVVADMGCGDAKIARTLTDFKVHSFDLVALNKHVTPCNISKVPLPDRSVDIVVFCLSLMGTNLHDYIKEAQRILKLDGVLKIAEVESRIPNLDTFIKSIESFRFTLENQDVQNKMFVFLDFNKVHKKSKKAKEVILNPCLYKKR